MKISNFFLVFLFCLYTGNSSAEIFYIDIDKIIIRPKLVNILIKNLKI